MRLDGNPTLRKVARNSEQYKAINATATVGGTAWKAALMCVVVIISSIVTAYLLRDALVSGNEQVLMWMIIGIAVSFIPMLIISFIIMFKPKTASVLGIIYCILDGVLVGFVSGLADLYYPGVALLALLGTCVVFLVSLAVFRLLGNRVSNGFIRFVMIASISMLILFAASFLLRMIFPAIGAMYQSMPWLQILVSAICILWATFMLLIDLNNVYRMAESGMDKSYEWLTAFSLTTTLVWLYLEILELLLKLLAIFGNRSN